MHALVVVQLITNLIMISMINVKICSFRSQPLKKRLLENHEVGAMVHSLSFETFLKGSLRKSGTHYVHH